MILPALSSDDQQLIRNEGFEAASPFVLFAVLLFYWLWRFA